MKGGFMRFLTVILFLWGMAFVSADSGPLIQVTILDRESNIRRVFENPEDLSYFRDIWEDRVLVPHMKEVEHWDYQMDVMTRDKSTRWLYDSHTGLCTVLSRDNRPVYHLRTFVALNNVLKAEPQEKVVWIIEERPVLYWREPWYDRSGWWRNEYPHYDHHHRDRYDHKRDRYDHDRDRDYKRDSKPEVNDRRDQDRSREEEYRERKREDPVRKPIPVYTPREDTERKPKPEGRPLVVPEERKPAPIRRPSIDERKLPGIRGLVRD